MTPGIEENNSNCECHIDSTLCSGIFTVRWGSAVELKVTGKKVVVKGKKNKIKLKTPIISIENFQRISKMNVVFQLLSIGLARNKNNKTKKSLVKCYYLYFYYSSISYRTYYQFLLNLNTVCLQRPYYLYPFYLCYTRSDSTLCCSLQRIFNCNATLGQHTHTLGNITPIVCGRTTYTYARIIGSCTHVEQVLIASHMRHFSQESGSP